ncbi:MAG: undecaprenyl-diphosphate phosphatase [Patescibacteria group bacterium]
MQSYFIATLLGLIQGFTEFLPVSSTGHLIVFENFFGIAASDAVPFDVAVHLATVLAVIWYFRADWIHLVKSFTSRIDTRGRQLLLNIILGTIPAGIAGILFEETITNTFRTQMAVAIGLIAGSALIAGAEYMRHRKNRDSGMILPYEGFIIGIFQAIALFPGISRSGATISGGLLLGKTRTEATHFSFLLSTPIILAAGLRTLASKPEIIITGPNIFGFIAAFISAIAAINLISRIAERSTLMPFVYYRLALAGVIILSLTF